MMKKTTIYFILVLLPFLFSFINFRLITLPAWYKYSGPYDVDYNYTNYQKGKLYFYFDPATTAAINTGSWNAPKVDSTFTAYLVNATDSTVQLTHQDGSLIMIQEAQDPTGKWSPIEVWYYSDCGNSYFNSPLIAPNQYIQVPIPKYRGTFKTKLRLKLKINKGVFYSEPFSGSVDPKQFKKDKTTERGGYMSYLED